MRRASIVTIVVFASALSAQTATRMAWQEFAKDPARVASFRKAVAVMRARRSVLPTRFQARTTRTPVRSSSSRCATDRERGPCPSPDRYRAVKPSTRSSSWADGVRPISPSRRSRKRR